MDSEETDSSGNIPQWQKILIIGDIILAFIGIALLVIIKFLRISFFRL